MSHAHHFFQALADATRLRCLMLMVAEEEVCVCEMTHALGEIQPKISRHLAALRLAGFILDRREAQWIYRGESPDRQGVTLTPCAAQAPLMRQLGLQQVLMVRFVRVRLSTGEWEVRVTSLCDEVAYPTADFLEVYHWRWGVETF